MFHFCTKQWVYAVKSVTALPSFASVLYAFAYCRLQLEPFLHFKRFGVRELVYHAANPNNWKDFFLFLFWGGKKGGKGGGGGGMSKRYKTLQWTCICEITIIKGDVSLFKGSMSFFCVYCGKKNLRRTAVCVFVFVCGEPRRAPQASVTSHRMFPGKLLYVFQKQTVTCHFLDISVPNLRLRDFDHEGGTNIARCSKSHEPSEDFAALHVYFIYLCCRHNGENKQTKKY